MTIQEASECDQISMEVLRSGRPRPGAAEPDPDASGHRLHRRGDGGYMRLRLLVEIRAAALADIHTRERQETRWRQNIYTGAAVCPAFIRKHWEVCCMKIMDKAAFEEQNVFGLGAPNDAFARYFAGRSYLNPLTRPEDGLFLANVTFEPGCRNNWHIHHASEGGGQLLICTAGEGWYQEEGKEAVSLEPGRVIVIPAEVKHWHGAKRDSWFSHIAVEMPGEVCSNEWCEPVSDAEYEAL